MPLLLLGFLVLPLVEIGVFVAVGSELGVLWTLALVVVASVVGLAIVRRQSMNAFRSARAEARAGRVPDRAIVHGAMIVFAGILLMLPGFVSDVFGLALLLPPVRDLLWRRLQSRVVVVNGTGRGYRPARNATPGVVELDEDEYARRSDDPNSPWRSAIEDETNPRDRRNPS